MTAAMVNQARQYLGKWVVATEQLDGQAIQSEGRCVGIIEYLEESPELLIELANGDRESVGLHLVETM